MLDARLLPIWLKESLPRRSVKPSISKTISLQKRRIRSDVRMNGLRSTYMCFAVRFVLLLTIDVAVKRLKSIMLWNGYCCIIQAYHLLQQGPLWDLFTSPLITNHGYARRYDRGFFFMMHASILHWYHHFPFPCGTLELFPWCNIQATYTTSQAWVSATGGGLPKMPHTGLACVPKISFGRLLCST